MTKSTQMGTGQAVHLLFALAPLLLTSACASRASLENASPQQLNAEVRAILGNDWQSAEYHRARNELQRMGPEVDSVLIGLVEDTRARTEARADALVLLADRRSPLALAALDQAFNTTTSACAPRRFVD